jgi:hypothetical protein
MPYASVYGMTTTPTKTPPADQIQNLWVNDNITWPVDYSLETAHEAVAVARLHGLPGYFLAVHIRGRWELVAVVNPTSIREALSLVPVVITVYSLPAF